LIAVQLASGILYAAYELAFLLMFLGDIPQARRTSLLTLYNFANSAAWCVGSIAGGIYLASGAASYHSYHQLFLISGVGRLACLILLWRVLAPVPSGPSFRVAFPEDSPPLGEPRASEAAFAQRRIA
jgi:MFS family permease